MKCSATQGDLSSGSYLAILARIIRDTMLRSIVRPSSGIRVWTFQAFALASNSLSVSYRSYRRVSFSLYLLANISAKSGATS